MKKSLFLLLILIILFNNPVSAESESQVKLTEIEFGSESYLVENYQEFKAKYQDLDRPVVGLALSGGGARAMVNFGVIKALEEAGIPIDFMSGTSMGAIVSTLYGGGLNTKQMLDVVTTTSFGRLIDLGIGGSGSLIDTKKLNLFMEEISPNKRLENFKVPAALLSFELKAGKKYLTTQGRISDVIQSSYSIPLYFPIEHRDDKYFMDAGILEATPAKAVSVLGADFVIATTSFPEKNTQDLNSARASINRFLNVLQDNYSQQIIDNYADFVIDIDVSDYNFMDFNQAAKLVELGYQKTKKQMPALKKRLSANGIELIKYQAREKSDIQATLSDLEYDRFVVEGRARNLFLNYGREKSYFDQDLIIPFADNFQTGINFKQDNFALDIKGDEFFDQGYEARFEIKKMTKKTDLLLAYGNDYNSATKDDYRLELKYFTDHFQNSIGFGRQQDRKYYLLGTKFDTKFDLTRIQSENDIIYDVDQSDLAILSSNIINLDLGDKWDLESNIVFNNTDVLNSPIIYRGQSLADRTEFQATLDFKYTYRFLDPLYFAGLFQTTDIGGYLFTDYYQDEEASGEAAGIGFNSQLYLLGLSPMEVDLYFAYDFDDESDRIGLEIGYEF
ncbi:patatin-like phospholipase family protein [Halanaerobium praevalens]|uniref:Patatin n=1 Tax=Halanaerobium praevalens (strain ATCC 33744 / DSM 2228 / GSL) TaxID=572479 RepID=E3DQN0_HALPG|nr:patatin-like phospholipase family protein [Halanaerobium praevalens]ADO77941.1 Patatin [Halanaerobium praevalens DSM 2228]